MTKINLIIPSRGFELIRDRIFDILSDEIPNQATLQSNTDIDANVFVERFLPFNKTELPAININMATGNFGNKKAPDGIATYNFNIDIYCAAKTDSTNFGDKKAAFAMEKIAGIILYIFSDAQYRTLLFDAPFITRVTVQDFNIKDPSTNGQDGLSTIMGRVNLEILAVEENELLASIALKESFTKVKLDETNKGLNYQTILP